MSQRKWVWLKCVLSCTVLTLTALFNFPSMLASQLEMALQVNIVLERKPALCNVIT